MRNDEGNRKVVYIAGTMFQYQPNLRLFPYLLALPSPLNSLYKFRKIGCYDAISWLRLHHVLLQRFSKTLQQCSKRGCKVLTNQISKVKQSMCHTASESDHCFANFKNCCSTAVCMDLAKSHWKSVETNVICGTLKAKFTNTIKKWFTHARLLPVQILQDPSKKLL